MHVIARGHLAPALLIFCAWIGATGCARQAPAAEQAAAPDGAQLFQRACARCHAADGSGGLPMASNGPRPIDLRNPAWQASRTDVELTAAIRDGRGAMPPFGDVLTPEEITALARHIRNLRGQAEPATDR